MSYISKKKRSKNFIAPTIFLSGLSTVATALAASPVSADVVQTRQNTHGNNSVASNPDAVNTASSATNSMSSAASSIAASNTSAAPSNTSSSSTGWINVSVDHSKMDEAVQNAVAQGVHVVHDPTVVVTGDASATATNASSAAAYYASQANAISSTAASYAAAMHNYNAQVAKNNSDAVNANANMEALRTNLAAQGQTVKMHSKQYSAKDVASDTAAIQKHIADGRAYLNVKNAITDARIQQNEIDFNAAANQGVIKIKRQTISVKTPADVQLYVKKLNDERKQLHDYMANLSNKNGTIPDNQKPTYTLYDFVIDSEVEKAGTSVVDVYNYTAAPVTKPTIPSISYHYYDIRSQMTGDSKYHNTDNNVIILNPNSNANGNKVAQAVVNQTVGIDTENQPIPAHRFDKIRDLTVVTKLPKDTTYDSKLTNSDPAHWTTTYDASTGTVTQTATAAYLVQINATDGEWKYKAPRVYFKLNKDNETYQASSTTIINKEYMFVSAGIQIRTDAANPSKVNENSAYQDIDGKAVLPGSINNYVLHWDFDQYKNVNIDTTMQSKGLHLVDDFPEAAVSLTGPISIIDPSTGRVLFSSNIPSGVKVGSTGRFQGTDGKDVDGLTWKVVDKTNAPDSLKGKLNGQAIMVSYTGVNGAFYKTYVQNGKSLDVVLPMTTKKITNVQKPSNGASTPDGTYNGNSYSNVAYQSDFGNDYKSNTVTNTVPKLDPKKDAVLSFAQLSSLDINNNKTAKIENGSWFDYRAKGSKLPTNLSEAIHSYVITDRMDNSADEYDGQFHVQTDSTIYFRAGSVLAQRYPNGLAAGSDISKYFTQTLKRNVSADGSSAVGTTNGADSSFNLITLSADADFLSQIDYSRTNLNFDAFLNTKRIANKAGVRNTFNEIINGVDYGSNTVVTNSSENALDQLQDKLNSLQSSAAAGISSNSSAVASMAGALSVVIKNVTSFQSATSSAVSSAISSMSSATSSIASSTASYFDYTKQQISLVSSAATSAASSIASSASAAIASNSAATDSVASSTLSAVSSATSSVTSTVNQLIASLASKLNAATDQSIATMTIYEPTVTTDAEALTYAVNHGISTGSIKSIKLNAAGKFVIRYNASSTGINNSSQATVNTPDNDTVAQSRMKINFYTLTSSDQVYRELNKLGYSSKQIIQVTKVNNVYTAIVSVNRSFNSVVAKMPGSANI